MSFSETQIILIIKSDDQIFFFSFFLQSERIKKSLRVLDKIYPQLFEYVLSVGLRLNVELKTYEPYIIYKFPEIVSFIFLEYFLFYVCKFGI